MTPAADPTTLDAEPALAPRVVVTADPENSEFPFAALHSWITPVPQFYVRNHFPVPMLDPAGWRLRVGNASFSLEHLQALPQHSVVATLECAGNGRSFCVPPVQGVQWGMGAVSNGEWGGPALRDVLGVAGVSDRAPHFHVAGADRGEARGRVTDYARSLPHEKALDPDTLVALRLNGAPLTPEHGAPARLIVPGWYGMASVKWVVTITPSEEPSRNLFMAEEYTRAGAHGGREPLEWVEPKAQIARPLSGSRLEARTVEVVGAAWAGHARVARVEVSADEGASWSAAILEGPDTRWAWRLWRWTWRAEPGEWTLLVRAVDAAGNSQPERADPSAPGYLNHWVRPHPVRVV